MTVRVYRSSDVGAPVLTGEPGKLLTVLDACLVSGYGTYQSSGWTKDFSTSLISSYRPPQGNRFQMVVDDTGSGNGWSSGYAYARHARFYGYETMSSISTGTNQFPSPSQSYATPSWDGVNGMYFIKSITADAYPRRWVMAATQTMMYFWVDFDSNIRPTGYTTTNVGYPAGALYAFGDISSFVANDAYATLIMGDTGTIHYYGYDQIGSQKYTSHPFNTNCGGHFMPRSYSQFGGSILAGKMCDYTKLNQATPAVVDGNIWILPVHVYEGQSTGIVRGLMPGFWQLGNTNNSIFQFGDIINGTGPLVGKTFLLIPTNGSRTRLLEISDTW